MDTKLLIAEAKARFNLNSAKAQLKEKYEGKFIVAQQGGLWKADAETLRLLSSFTAERIVIIDTFGTPLYVERELLLTALQDKYHTVMHDWLVEYTTIENMR
jgi:hypothetical protein